MSQNHLHHVHLFASDLDRSIAFYEQLGGELILDTELAGARNVFMKLGDGRIHFYDQPPPAGSTRGAIHHLGIRTDDLEGLVARLQAAGVSFRKPIADFGIWKYVMAPAPDNVLLELFQVDQAKLPPQLASYFCNR